jgi:hypothetical protein
MLVVRLAEPVPVDINYDTLVVEDGVLHIYPDVYARGTNRLSQLRAELQSSNVDVSTVTDETLKRMLRRVTPHTQFVVETASIAKGRALEDGRVLPLIPKSSKVQRPKSKPEAFSWERRYLFSTSRAYRRLDTCPEVFDFGPWTLDIGLSYRTYSQCHGS